MERRGGLHGKDGKGECEKRCVPGAALQNHHMGHVEYSLLTCILRSHTLNAHYTAFLCKKRLRLCEGRAAEDGL